MEQFLLANQLPFSRALFYGPLLLFMLMEELFPRRSIQLSLKTRWTANFGFMLVNVALQKLLIPITAIELAFLQQHNHSGLFNLYPIPEPIVLVLSLIILDGIKYAWHRLSHRLPILWRLHRVHHSDVDFDVSTSVRHHPLEMLVTTALDFGMVWLFGFPPGAMVLWAAVSTTADLFNHSNIRLPNTLDRLIRWLLVTPDMHRIHHSSFQPETDSNFSSFLSFWDFLFRSYRANPHGGQDQMQIGLDKWRGKPEQSIFQQLLNPIF